MGRDLRLRLHSRAYLFFTGLFYLLVALACTHDGLHFESMLDPGLAWACAFVLTGVLSLMGWASRSYELGRKALYLAASVAGGFSVLFLSHTLTGELSYYLGAAVWAYISVSHFAMARLPDPFILALFEAELEKLEYRLGAKNDE